MKAYKILERTEDGKYKSIGFMELDYELHKETVAPGNSLLFVYDSLVPVVLFIPKIKQFLKYYAVFEVEVDKLESLDWMLYTSRYSDPKQAIRNFWENKYSFSIVETRTPKGTKGAKVVRLTKEIGIIKLTLYKLLVKILG